MAENTALVGFVCPEYTPEEEVADLLNNIDKEMPFDIRREPFHSYAALEWVVPTLFITWISKSYFESFLKEAGKDHYTIFKPWVIRMVGKARAFSVTTLSASKSTKKVNQGYSQSKAMSVVIQLQNGRVLKVLFDNDLTQEDWEEGIDKMLDMAVVHYQQYPQDVITLQTNELNIKPHHSLYAVLDTTSEWIVLDDRGMQQRETGRRLEN